MKFKTQKEYADQILNFMEDGGKHRRKDIIEYIKKLNNYSKEELSYITKGGNPKIHSDIDYTISNLYQDGKIEKTDTPGFWRISNFEKNNHNNIDIQNNTLNMKIEKNKGEYYMNNENQFKIGILTFLSDNNEHPRTVIIDHVAKNYLKDSLNKNKHYPIEKIKLAVELSITKLYDYHYIKKSKIRIDNWIITKKGQNYLKKNNININEKQSCNLSNIDNKSQDNSKKNYIDIKLEEFDQKIDSNSYEIYEMINYLMEDLYKTDETLLNKILTLEKLVNNNQETNKINDYNLFENNENDIELLKYIKLTTYDKYLTNKDLYKLLHHLGLNHLNIYSEVKLKEIMIEFYKNNSLNSNEYIIEGKNTTYFMNITFSDSDFINKISFDLVNKWINDNIIFSDDSNDKILFNDLLYEIVKSFKLNNINRIYYENIDSILKKVLLSLYTDKLTNNYFKTINNIIICYGLKYKCEISLKETKPKVKLEEPIQTVIYNWLNDNLIKINNSNIKLALNDIYDNILPYLNDKNFRFEKRNITYTIGRSINNIYQGKYKIKREIINNQTFYIGLKLKNPINSESLENYDNTTSHPNKKPSELIENWIEKRISINENFGEKLYLDTIIDSFITDLSKKNIEIKDSSGLRSNMSRLLRLYYKEKTNKKIYTQQDNQLKRYYKKIHIKEI